MATDQISSPKVRTTTGADRQSDRVVTQRQTAPLWIQVLTPLASLKLTVTLMALSIFIVLAGTFAQARVDIWDAIREYFRLDFASAFNTTFPFMHPGELFVWIDAKLFFPPSFFPADPAFPAGLEWIAAIWPTQQAIQSLPDSVGIWFPRGWTIGVVMMANLLAAHILRFKLQAKGKRLWIGVATLCAGLIVTYSVIASHDEGVTAEAWISYDGVWRLMQAGLVLLGAAGVYGAATMRGIEGRTRIQLLVVSVLMFVALSAVLLIPPLAPESMRILYQLIKGLVASSVLLLGCVLLFKKRAGIVLLHGGVGLLMAYEVLVGTQHIESQMVIPEGVTTNFAHDIRATELAIVDTSDPLQEKHIVVSASLLTRGLASPDAIISDSRLPFVIKVLKWLPNAMPEPLKPGETSEANQGFGKLQKLVPLERSVGTDSKSDFPGAYVQIFRRGPNGSAGESLGTYMLTTITDSALRIMPFAETVRMGGADGKSYEMSLRFVRHYKDYQVELIDVQKNDYAGTTSARDWRSVVNFYLPDGSKQLDHYEIWMNNPLRIGGETFYQQEWKQTTDGEITTLQVVQNEGWMAPYVACMIVAVGMCYQFGLGLFRFADRLHRSHTQSLTVTSDPSQPVRSWSRWGLPLAVSLLVGLTLYGYAGRQRTVIKNEFNLSAFADLPVVMGGRSLPLESVAMNRLMQISDLQSFKEKDPDPTDRIKPKSQPAIQWFLDMVARPELADTYPVFRIENDTIARSLGLEISENLRYAYADFKDKLPELRQQMASLNEKPRSQWSVEERKRAELIQNVSRYLDLRGWFDSLAPQIQNDFPEIFDPNQTRVARASRILDMVRRLDRFSEDSKEFRVPLVIPMHLGEAQDSITRFNDKLARTWDSFPVASGFATLDGALGTTPPPAFGRFQAILDAWKDQDATRFNEAVTSYRSLLESASKDQMTIGTTLVDLKKSAFEGYYNRIGAFNLLSFSYLTVLLLALASWTAVVFGKSGVAAMLQRTAFWIGLTLFVMHTLGIVARIYISGRPPVTNLYSSAIFIGWAAVLFGLVFEGIFRIGVGNIVAALSGFATLRIAHALMTDGDTLAVLEAVLDTQFWLATHVVCITLGYAATYVAGVMGLIYVATASRFGLPIVGLFAILGGGLGVAAGGPVGLGLGGVTLLFGFACLVVGIRWASRDFELPGDLRNILPRITYGTLCGATVLSFVGTVLGGLWADDSWGRFWGWDPKENGALIIVMWNALILHARWDRMIHDRGLAALAILGNVVTSWSWFGVNELGIGLHSYGFTEGRLFWLLMFCVSQLAVFTVAMLPQSTWRKSNDKVAVS